jgi:hypothetical protein
MDTNNTVGPDGLTASQHDDVIDGVNVQCRWCAGLKIPVFFFSWGLFSSEKFGKMAL